MNNNNNISEHFDLPDGYFNQSQSAIINKIAWLEENKTYPLLLNLKNQTGFTVPLNYFQKAQVKLENSPYPTLQATKKENTFETPEFYFNNTIQKLQLQVASADELSSFSVLNSITKTSGFTTSDAYFEKNSKKLIAANLNETKIIRLNKKPIWLAAAAVLTIVLSVWLYQSFFNTAISADNDCKTLACIERKELLKYKLDQLDNDELYDIVNTEKLLEKLNVAPKTDSLSNTDSIDTSLLDYIE